ncbi:MAG TPA: M20/M25/M40 family metallo-hydrolase [Nitrospirales bacterium]|nr:M20/M25/M40 family metallo-hydrolase [Nitrospirales bacterium]
MNLFQSLDGHIRQSRARFESWLGRLVDVPTVSMDPARRDDVRAGAAVAADYLASLGADASIVETGGHPMVVGGWAPNPAWPTVAVYNHVDVQPAIEPEWTRDPFQFSIDGDLYFGRGTTDDKGPALTTLFAAHYAVEYGVPLNIQFVWELEEEIGSPHFAAGLARATTLNSTRPPRALSHPPTPRLPGQASFHGDAPLLRRPDSVVVSDTIWLAGGRPAVPYGLRGLLAARLTLETATREAHSGLTGGAARNPLAELCAVVESCVDAASGRVKIPGFYKMVRPLGKKDRAQFLRSGFQVKTFAAAHQLTKLRARDRAGVMRRLWAEPTFEVHGFVGGYTGPGVKTSIPPRAEAKVSMRLVPDQDPAAVFALLRKYVRSLNPDVRVEPEGMLRPYVGDLGGPYVEAVRQAMRFGFGKEPAFIREGGSIGAVVTMVERWRAPVIFLGLSLPNHGYHAPNERFDWGQASGGMRAFVKYFDELSRIAGAPP